MSVFWGVFQHLLGEADFVALAVEKDFATIVDKRHKGVVGLGLRGIDGLEQQCTKGVKIFGTENVGVGKVPRQDIHVVGSQQVDHSAPLLQGFALFLQLLDQMFGRLAVVAQIDVEHPRSAGIVGKGGTENL